MSFKYNFDNQLELLFLYGKVEKQIKSCHLKQKVVDNTDDLKSSDVNQILGNNTVAK